MGKALKGEAIEVLSGEELLHYIRARGFRVYAKDPQTVSVGPRECLTDGLRALIREHKQELLEALREEARPSPVEAAEVAAVKMSSPRFGELWLVADERVLEDNPDIEASGLPVVFFEEVAVLEGLKDHPNEIRAFLELKRCFPRGRTVLR